MAEVLLYKLTIFSRFSLFSVSLSDFFSIRFLINVLFMWLDDFISGLCGDSFSSSLHPGSGRCRSRPRSSSRLSFYIFFNISVVADVAFVMLMITVTDNSGFLTSECNSTIIQFWSLESSQVAMNFVSDRLNLYVINGVRYNRGHLGPNKLKF